MDRPDAGPPGRARARARRRDLPDPRRGRERHRVPRPAAPLQGRDPAHQPGRAGGRRAGAAAPQPARAAACRSTRPGRRPAPSASTGRRAASWMRRNLATSAGRMLLELGIEAVWAAQPEDLSLLHVLFYIHSAGSLDMLFETEGGAQQDRFVGGLAAGRAADGGGARRARRAGRAGAAHRARRRRGDGARRRRARARQAGARGDRADARRPHRATTRRCPATATSSPSACRWARSSSAWRSTTSRSGAARACRDRGRATPARSRSSIDNSPPDGSPGVLLGFLEGRHARELGRASAERAARRP